MADIYDNYDLQCKDTLGGIKRAWLLPFDDLDETQVIHDGLELIEFPLSRSYKFEVTGNFSQQTSGEKGLIAFDQSASIKMSKIYNFWDVNVFLRNRFRLVILDNNGNHILLGADNGLRASVSNLSGDSKQSFNGFTINFTGREESNGLYVDAFEDFFYEGVDAGSVFNYDLNFDII